MAVPAMRWHVEGREPSSSLVDPGNDSSRGSFSFLKSNFDHLTSSPPCQPVFPRMSHHTWAKRQHGTSEPSTLGTEANLDNHIGKRRVGVGEGGGVSLTVLLALSPRHMGKEGHRAGTCLHMSHAHIERHISVLWSCN